MSIGQEEKEAVLRVLDSGVLSGYKGNWSESFYGGPEVRALEKEWAEYFGVKHAVVCNSATSGLFLACAAVGLQQNHIDINKKCIVERKFEGPFSPPYYIPKYQPDEIIVSPWSMTCSASIPLHFGAKPIFADIEEDYFCLDPKAVEAKITPNTKAIIVVDLFGCPYAADEINAIAKKHGIYVIEDAAQAIGAKYKGKYAGTLGDIGVFSLNVHKHIQCGEGGVVVTDNNELAFRLRLLMNHSEAVMNDMVKKETLEPNAEWKNLDLVGLNLRMTELQAAIAREQLKKLAGILEIVRDNAKYFPVKVRPECESSFYRYAYTGNDSFGHIDKWPEGRAIGFEATKEHGGKSYYWLFNRKRHYITPLHRLPLFRHLGYPDNLCPVCEKVEENIVLAWLKEVV